MEIKTRQDARQDERDEGDRCVGEGGDDGRRDAGRGREAEVMGGDRMMGEMKDTGRGDNGGKGRWR